MFTNDEIQKRVQHRYIERVSTRLKKMRKLLIDRDWNTLKAEATQLAEGAQNFGFTDLAGDVQKAIEVLNNTHLTRTAIDQEAKSTLETLFKKLDRFLVEEHKL
jgi:HPt (histidine-containing phosphotransfer) domain-containing protein